MNPVSAVIRGEVFAGGSDDHPAATVDVRQCRAESGGLAHREPPGLSAVQRSRGDVLAVGYFLVVSAEGDHMVLIGAHGKNSRRRVALQNRCSGKSPSDTAIG